MAYFPNGTSADVDMARMCKRCVHYQKDKWCPVLDLHWVWNYEAVGTNADATKHMALNTLWPVAADGVQNDDCRMFYGVAASERK